MSWDIVAFSSRQKINAIEEMDEEQFIPINFNDILEKNFDNIVADEDHREIKGHDYSVEYFAPPGPAGAVVFSLYGENGLYELIRIAKIYNWQIFDTGNGEMINLDHPEKNGYENFQNYLREIIKNTGHQ